MKYWLYFLTGALLLTLCPILISAADTLKVLLGVALIIAFGVWTWKLVQPFIDTTEI